MPERSILCVGLVMQRGENPLLQNASAIRIDLAKRQAHTQGWFDMRHHSLSLEVLTGVENLHQDGNPDRERCKHLQITPVQAEFRGANRDSCVGRTFRCDLGGGAECKPKSAAVLAHRL